MIIPKGGKERANFLKYVCDVCTQSKQDRIALYSRRRRYFLFGANQGASLNNQIDSHLDLVGSFLYSPDHARYSVPPFPLDSTDDVQTEQLIALGRYWNDEFKDSDLAYQFGECLTWSLVYDTMFLKLGWNDATKDLFGRIIDPAHMAVFDEAVPDLDNQDAFVHTYMLSLDEATQRMSRAGLVPELKKLTVEPGPGDEGAIPSILRNMIVPAGPWGPTVTDPLIGQVNTASEPTPTYASATEAPMVRWHEIYVWDDQFNDYSIFTMGEPDVVISDSRETLSALKAAGHTSKKQFSSDSNIFLPGEHPFIQVQPYAMYDYFWGAAHIEKMIGLQQWADKRITEIQQLLARQVRPSKLFSGFGGNVEEKYGAMEGPDTWVSEMPGADVKELKPEIPADCFAELKEIKSLFLERSGLTETTSGRGEAGVRGGGHAKQLAMTGSGRIRKIAVGLEKPLGKLGDIAVKLLMKNSEDKLRTATKMQFLPAQTSAEYRIRIAGHSHSPLFRDETKDDAIVLLKSGAIDAMMLIDILNPPNAAELKFELRKRIIAKQKERQQQIAQGIEPDDGKKKKAA